MRSQGGAGWRGRRGWWLVLFSAGLALASAIGCWPGRGRAPWIFRDLWLEPPRVTNATAEAVLGTINTLHDRTLRSLRLVPGATLEWRWQLGDAAQFRARPWSKAPCMVRFEVQADGGKAEPLWHQRLPALGVSAPTSYLPQEPLSLDLAAWAGQEVALRVSTDAADAGCGEAWLVSPGLVERRRPARVDAPRPYRKPDDLRPNIVLLTVDTLRADAVGAWGRSPSVTPALDALAARSDVYANAFATVNSTNPSFVSLMTGLYAKNHRIFDLETRLPDAQTTLIESFEQTGYITRAVIAATHLSANSGLRQGVHSMVEPWGQFYGETVANQAIHWITDPAAMHEPFFLWIHFFDPHVPHSPPLPYARGMVQAARRGLAPAGDWKPWRATGLREFELHAPRFLEGDRQLYLDEVAYTDRQIDRILAALESSRLLDRTVVVFVADHGETLGERGSFFDHMGLHDNTTHVPMMVHHPGQQVGRRFEGLVQHFDLYPSILRLGGLEPPAGIDALALEDLGTEGRAAIFANHADDTGAAVRTSRFLYYRNDRDKLWPVGEYLYDLEADPGQERNLAGQGHPEQARLRGQLDAFLAHRRPPVAEPIKLNISAEEKAQLEALGYVR
jgi:arylsulfatase